VAPRPVAPQIAPRPRLATPYDRPRFSDGPITIAPRLVAASLVTAPVPVQPVRIPLATPQEELPHSLAKRSMSLAVCAVAVLGAVSAAAMLVPQRSSAQAETLGHDTSATRMPLPAGTPMMERYRHHHRHHHRGHHRLHVPAKPVSQLTETAAPLRAASATPSAHAKPSASPSASPTASSTPTSTPTPSSSGPAGSPGSAVGSLLAAFASGDTSLSRGTYTFSDFRSSNVGAMLPSGGFTGAGESQTVVEMTPHSSSKGGLVPTASGTTNPLSLLKVQGGSPLLRDFTVQGTNQGHLYNGLQIKGTSGARIENVRVNAVPGDSRVNPGETFGINDFHTSGSRYSGVEVDGAGVGASALAFNSSSNATVSDSYFHDNPYSAGIAIWQTSNVTMTDIISKDNRTGVNLERASGDIRLVRPTLENNSAQDIYVGSDQSSAKITIIDPVFSGKLRIKIASPYWAGPEQQKRSDIHVIINGQDRTNDVVAWI
jgi:hypothetical protein